MTTGANYIVQVFIHDAIRYRCFNLDNSAAFSTCPAWIEIEKSHLTFLAVLISRA